jgi:integrase
VTEIEGTKNLSQQRTRIKKRAAGATKLSKADVKGKLVDFLWWMKKQGYKKSTIEGRVKFLRTLVNRGANLLDPESIKETLALEESWKDGYKANLVDAYSCFLEMEGLTWKPPIYRRYHKLPFIPLESEIDQLIAGCGKKVSTFVQASKETGADPGELLAVTWMDVNKQSRTLTINHPVKGHNARILPISKHLIARLEMLPKESERIFPMTYDSMASNYWGQRKRLARNFNNPRLLKITFTTLRHWKATTLYHKTRDILRVKKFLGHKTLMSTMIYIDIEKAIYGQMSQEFTVRVAEEPEEIKKLLEAGFEYVCEKDRLMFFRKRD